MSAARCVHSAAAAAATSDGREKLRVQQRREQWEQRHTPLRRRRTASKAHLTLKLCSSCSLPSPLSLPFLLVPSLPALPAARLPAAVSSVQVAARANRAAALCSPVHQRHTFRARELNCDVAKLPLRAWRMRSRDAVVRLRWSVLIDRSVEKS